jgi:hypothetical protein
MKLRALATNTAAITILIMGAISMQAQNQITPNGGLGNLHFIGSRVAMLNLAIPSGNLNSDPTCPPLTQGYWKNHQSVWKDGTGLTLGTNFYTNAQLETILQTPVRGDASVALARQMIAALLNIANGTDPGPIQAALADANNLIGSGTIPEGISPSSSLGQQMEADASVFDDFNNGDITDACSQAGPPQ